MPVYGRPLQRRADHKMKYGRVDGIDKDISRVVMGCDNQRDLRHATVMWDDFIELGGNCFDTAYIYGNLEEVLGKWMKNRGNRDDVVLIDKGAHSPNCYPDKLKEQFMERIKFLSEEWIDAKLRIDILGLRKKEINQLIPPSIGLTNQSSNPP